MQVQQLYPEDDVVQYNNLYFRFHRQDDVHVFTAQSFYEDENGPRDLVVKFVHAPDERTRQILMDPFCVLPLTAGR